MGDGTSRTGVAVRRAAVLAAMLCVAARGEAQTASQQVRIDVRPINQLAVIGATTFTVPARAAGGATVVSLAAKYAVTTNEENRRIVVAIDEALPDGVTLRMRMDAPQGAVAADEVILSTAPQTAVTGISRLNARELGIGFSLTTGAGVVVPAATTRTVKVTLVSAA